MPNLISRWLRIPLISGRVIFIIFVGLVLINLILLVSYTKYNKEQIRLRTPEEIVIHLKETIYLLELLPEADWARLAEVSETPELNVVLSSTPYWPLQTHINSLYQIDSLLHTNHEKFAISIQLKNHIWLNAKFTPHTTRELLSIFIIMLGTVVALALLFSAWTVLRFTKPLKQFKKAALQLGMELRTSPLIEYGPAIVRETADAMNQMQTRIRNLLQDRNQMLAAISHDLRTPITRLKLRVQFIQDKEFFLDTLNDLDEMEAMIDQILTYTKEAYSQEKLVDLDLVALLYALCDEKCEQGYQVECISDKRRIVIKGRSLALKRAFTNIISNATKYAHSVFVKISYDNNQIVVLIEDDGPGIPDDQLEKVFTAFYRVDQSRSAKTGGAGLGLAIAQDVIHEHRGCIILKNRGEGGLQVKVILEQGHIVSL